jgi:uncharacterized protein DUF2505
MAKALDYTFDLPYTPEQLFEQGVKLEYIEAQAKTLNHYNIELTALENGPEGGRATAKYEVEVDLPSWAKKILAPRNKVTEIRNWGPPEADGSRAYTFQVRLENVPVDIRGVVKLQTAPGGTRELVHIDLKAGLPIFGSKLEELVAAQLEGNVKGETAFAETWMKTRA